MTDPLDRELVHNLIWLGAFIFLGTWFLLLVTAIYLMILEGT